MSPRSGLNHEMILNQAYEIAERDGLEAVTMAALAKELNIKSPSLYNHIDGLNEVRQALSLKALELLSQYLKEATLDKTNGPEAIRAFGHAYIEFAHRHPGLYEATLPAPDSSPENVKQAGDELVRLTRAALSSYLLEEEKVIHAVRGLRSLLHGWVDLNRKGGFKMRVDLRESQAFILEIFIKGLEG